VCVCYSHHPRLFLSFWPLPTPAAPASFLFIWYRFEKNAFISPNFPRSIDLKQRGESSSDEDAYADTVMKSHALPARQCSGESVGKLSLCGREAAAMLER